MSACAKEQNRRLKSSTFRLQKIACAKGQNLRLNASSFKLQKEPNRESKIVHI